MLINTKRVMLSPSGLSVFKSCPRCFWLEKVGGIKRPRGIFPSLPGGMDRVIKPYYDGFRKTGTLPPEVSEVFTREALLLYPDVAKLEVWRNWRSGLKYAANKYQLSGALDDLLVRSTLHSLEFSPFDYKTKGSKPKEGDGERYYQHQLDCYALLLEKNGMPTDGKGYLVFYYPVSVGQSGVVQFATELTQLKTSVTRAEDLCRAASDCLNAPMPEPSEECEYCNHHGALTKNAAKLITLGYNEIQEDLPLTLPKPE